MHLANQKRKLKGGQYKLLPLLVNKHFVQNIIRKKQLLSVRALQRKECFVSLKIAFPILDAA